MCTYLTEKVGVTGSGKGPGGWFPLSEATVYFDHPVHAPAEHTVNIDFQQPGAGARGAGRGRADRGMGPRARRRHHGHPRGRPAWPDLTGTVKAGPRPARDPLPAPAGPARLSVPGARIGHR